MNLSIESIAEKYQITDRLAALKGRVCYMGSTKECRTSIYAAYDNHLFDFDIDHTSL